MAQESSQPPNVSAVAPLAGTSREQESHVRNLSAEMAAAVGELPEREEKNPSPGNVREARRDEPRQSPKSEKRTSATHLDKPETRREPRRGEKLSYKGRLSLKPIGERLLDSDDHHKSESVDTHKGKSKSLDSLDTACLDRDEDPSLYSPTSRRLPPSESSFRLELPTPEPAAQTESWPDEDETAVSESKSSHRTMPSLGSQQTITSIHSSGSLASLAHSHSTTASLSQIAATSPSSSRSLESEHSGGDSSTGESPKRRGGLLVPHSHPDYNSPDKLFRFGVRAREPSRSPSARDSERSTSQYNRVLSTLSLREENKSRSPENVVRSSAESLRDVCQQMLRALPLNPHCIKLVQDSTPIDLSFNTRTQQLIEASKDSSPTNHTNIASYMHLECIVARLKLLVAMLEGVHAEGPAKPCQCAECYATRGATAATTRASENDIPRAPKSPLRSFSFGTMAGARGRKVPASGSTSPKAETPTAEVPLVSSCLTKFCSSFLRLGGMEALLPLMWVRGTWLICGVDQHLWDGQLHEKMHVEILKLVSTAVELLNRKLLDLEMKEERKWWGQPDTLLASFFANRALLIGHRKDWVSWEFLEAGFQVVTEGRVRPFDTGAIYSGHFIPPTPTFYFLPLSLQAIFNCVSHASAETQLLVFKHLTFLFAQQPGVCGILLRMPRWQDLFWRYAVLTHHELAHEDIGSMAMHVLVVLLFSVLKEPIVSFAALLTESVNRLLIVTKRAPNINTYVRQVLLALVYKVAKGLKTSIKDFPEHKCWDPVLQLLEATYLFVWAGHVPGQDKELKDDTPRGSHASGAQDMRYIFGNPVLLFQLTQFVQRQGVLKHEMAFWLDVQQYQQIRLNSGSQEERLAKAEQLATKFLEPNSAEELKAMPVSLRAAARQLIPHDYRCEAFDELQGAVAEQLEQGLFHQFVQSSEMKQGQQQIEQAQLKRQQKGSGRLHFAGEKLGIHCDMWGRCVDIPLLQQALSVLQGVGRTADGKPGWANDKGPGKKLSGVVQTLREELQTGLSFLQALEQLEIPSKKLCTQLAGILQKRLGDGSSDTTIADRLQALAKEQQLLVAKYADVDRSPQEEEHKVRPRERPPMDTYMLQEKRKMSMSLVVSEQEYVNEMMALSSLYLGPLIDNHMALRDKEATKRFLGLVHQMAVTHARMLKDFRKCTDYMQLIRVLEDYVHYFKCYFFYAQSFPSLLMEFEDTRTLAKFMSDTAAFNGHDSVRVLLNRPLLRIPEYVQVLETLDGDLPADHPDLPAVLKCLQAVKATASLISEHKTKSENSAQLYRLHMLVKGLPEDWTILSPSRRFLGSCVCTEMFAGCSLSPPATHPAKHSRRWYLMDDALVITTWEHKYLARVEYVDARPAGKLVMQLWSGLQLDDSEPMQAFLFDTTAERDKWHTCLSQAHAARLEQHADLEMRGANRMHQAKDEMQTVKVCMRIRPFANAEERALGLTCLEVKNKVVTLKQEGQPDRVCYYDHVFTPVSTQDDVFDTIGRETLGAIFAGSNVCIFAYGNTGAGKSYTMFGPDKTEAKTGADLLEGQDCFMATPEGFALATVEKVTGSKVQVKLAESGVVNEVDKSALQWENMQNRDSRGLIPRILHWVFSVLSASSYEKVRVKLAYMQVYNGEVHDLQSAQQVDLRLKQTKRDHYAPKNLTMTRVASATEAMSILELGNTRRVTRPHRMNVVSSRSHAIVVLRVAFKSQGKTTKSRVHLVDLAGCESLSEEDSKDSTQTNNDKLREESQFVNQSLASLGRVVHALVENTKRVKEARVPVPFRESPLTMLLSEVLSGEFVCTLMLNVSPSPANNQRTLSAKTMAFGEGIKRLPHSKDRSLWYTSLWNAISRS